MRAAALGHARLFVPATASPRAEDRWLRPGPAGTPRATAMAAILLGSLLVHGAFVTAALVGDRSPPPAVSEEIPVEVVPEPPPEPAAKAEKAAEAPAEPAPAAKVAEAPPPEPEPKPDLKPALKPEPPPPVATASSEPSRAEPDKPEPAKPEPPPQAAQAAHRPAPEPDGKAMAELKALQDELAGLKSEHDTLQADAAQQAAEQAQAAQQAQAALRAEMLQPVGMPTALGPLPSSFQAVALPGETAGEGDVVGYEAIVFSRLAKAKEMGARMGQPGSAGVRFAIDEHGTLLTVQVTASSGIKALDDEAVSIVHKAAPFPPPPDGKGRSLSANVSFVATR